MVGCHDNHSHTIIPKMNLTSRRISENRRAFFLNTFLAYCLCIGANITHLCVDANINSIQHTQSVL